MIIRAILPPWAQHLNPEKRTVLEGEFTDERITSLSESFYNIYYLPNYPAEYKPGAYVDGEQIDTFKQLFVDFDLKSGTYESKEHFVRIVKEYSLKPSKIVDSGNGVHAYWNVSDLDAMSYLKLERRLMRHFNTDPAVGQIYQLMRLPGTLNTKNPDDFKLCSVIEESAASYTSEQFDTLLPLLTPEDEEYCKQHYDKTYNDKTSLIKIEDKMPAKFGRLLESNKEAKNIWLGHVEDRSKGDYRFAHLMFASGFTKEEAASVLVNSPKALERGSKHRISYAYNMIDKIWTFELEPKSKSLDLSSTVKDILSRSGDTLKGTRFPCYPWIDNTQHGFRLGHVIGLVAGSGVGKTAVALNMFMGFVESNPDYEHFFIPLEQKAEEIADRWRTMCGDRTYLHEKVHVISNYDEDLNFRHLSFGEIKEYILRFQKETGKKIGCVVIDHIGALNKKGNNGENQDLMNICHEMKGFAVSTNTLLVMQSQAPREKAGIGDLELNKDAAYGTVFFESYCDYLITMWQPLKRCYSEPACPAVTALKFCKIRHKKQSLDRIQEDVPYTLFFDSVTEHLRELTQREEESFDYFNKSATNKRKADRKTDVVEYTSIKHVTTKERV